jgi:hypothetical protein
MSEGISPAQTPRRVFFPLQTIHFNTAVFIAVDTPVD